MHQKLEIIIFLLLRNKIEHFSLLDTPVFIHFNKIKKKFKSKFKHDSPNWIAYKYKQQVV